MKQLSKHMILIQTSGRREISRRMTKLTKWPVRWVKTQISLVIRPVWSESLLYAWRHVEPLTTYWAHGEDSDLTGWMPRLIRVFAGCKSLCWFCHVAAQICCCCVAVLWFYGPLTLFSSFQVWSVNLSTLFLGKPNMYIILCKQILR